MISLSTTTLVGFIFETLFYGVFLVVFGISANLQWGRYKQESLTFGNKLAFAFSILLCLFITTHWWLNLWGVYEAFLRTPTSLDREMLLADLGVTTAIAKLAIYEIQLWMGDVLLIYRLYYVAGRKWIVVVPPVLMCCTLITCSSHSVYYASRFDFTQPQTLPAILWSIRKWSIATFSVTVAGNIYCLALISFFIWRTHRAVCQTTSSGLQSVLRIIIESAGMWVFFILLTFIVYLSNENACYIFLYLTNPVLGISFCMMIIRLQLRNNAAVMGFGNARPPCVSNFRVAPKEHSPDTAGSPNAPNELMVFSSKRTVNDPTFDTTAPTV